jgi:DNA-binding LacI/PurR family transcriptional regulator
MPITIRDIAAMARVSKGTVSKVLNEAPGVGAETRTRVLDIVKRLDYQPNASAQSLAARRTDNIGVIIPHTGNYSMGSAYWPVLLTAITQRAAASNRNVLLSTARSEEDVDSAYRSILRGRRVDGLIVGAEQFEQKQLAELVLKGFPFVMVGRSPFLTDWYVDVDNTGGSRAMTRHLVDLGHQHIVLLAGPQQLVSVRDRVEGYSTVMTAAGLQPRVLHCPYQGETATQDVKDLLMRAPRATALFVAAGDLALTAIRAASEMDLSIPDDLALVTFDDNPYYEIFRPPITAVSQPIHDLGEAAVDLLFALMEGRTPEQTSRVLPTTLTIRQSCQHR